MQNNCSSSNRASELASAPEGASTEAVACPSSPRFELPLDAVQWIALGILATWDREEARGMVWSAEVAQRLGMAWRLNGCE